MKSSHPTNLFDDVFFDDSFLDAPPIRPKLRRARAMPGALVPQFVKVGDFWVPDEWKLRADAVEDVQACRVRRSIVRRRPPIDFESLLELGELFGVNPVDGAEPHLFHVRVAGSEYCYAPETRVARGPAGEALIRLDVPGGILLVPRRHPRKPPPGARPDLRDWVEVVCVFDHEGLFHAAPLADGWRFALVWGPSVPALEPLLRAMHAQDAGFLTLQRDPDAPRRFEEPLDFVLPSDDAATYLDALYRLARDGILSVAHLDPTRRPQPVLRIYPGASAYVAELWFQYDRLLVPPFDVPHSAETGSRERFVVRHFATEESALETIVGLFGEPDEPGTWLLTPRRVEGHRSALGTLQREHGWQVEVAYEPTSRGRRKRRATGLKSEPVFRKLADEPLDREGELAYQRYSERALALAAEEADEIARALAESARPDDAFPDGDVGPDADADETAFPPEAAKPERRLPLVDLRRSIEHFVVGQQFHLLAQRMRKVTELRRLQATERQSSETLAQALAFAEGMVTQAGHRVKAHQRDALRGVLHRLWAGEGAILALPVGYGKTLVALLVAVTLQRLGVVQSPVLWIGTKSTLVSLRGDLEKFMPALRVNDYTGPRRQQTFVGVDLVFTTYDLLRRETHVELATGRPDGVFVEQAWGLLVVDEVSVAANPSTGNFAALSAVRRCAQRTLLLNATMLENTTVDLWSHLELASPGAYGGHEHFAWFDRALLGADETARQAREEVRRNIFAYAVDERQCSDADIRLPDLTWRPVSVIELTPDHAESIHTFQTVVARYLKQRRTAHRVGGAITALRRGCHAPRFLVPNAERSLDPRIQNGPTPRADAVADLVAAEVAAGHRCLVFSSWLDTLFLIERSLIARGLSSDLLAGPTAQETRAELAAKWGDSDAPPADTAALLLHPVAGGRGLNLVGADRVIFAEPFWNPALMQQCVGRAHRMRQRRPVEVIVFRSEAAIERMVERRANAKRQLAEAVFGGERLSTTDALAAWVAHHELLGDPDAAVVDEATRVARVGEAIAAAERARSWAEARLAEAAAKGIAGDALAALKADLKIEVMMGEIDLISAVGEIGGRLAVTDRELEAFSAAVLAIPVHQ